MKPTALVGFLIIAVYVALSPAVAWPLYYSLLFQPDHTAGLAAPWRSVENDFHVSRKEVTFRASDGPVLHGWFFKLPQSQRIFLVSGGKGGSLYNRAGMARMLLRCGGSVMLYSYRGYGQSGGTPSLEGVCKDADAAYDYLIEHEGAQPKDIIAYGESFGSGVTSQLVQSRAVGGVILQSGFSSLLRASRDVLPWLRLYPDSWFPHQRMDNIAVFKMKHPPLLIVHGEKDQLVSSQNARDLFAAAIEPKSLLILPEGDHGSFGKGNEYFVAVEKFLRDNNL
jgi:fermentation-respiration switch protein FrsA (DUF1100 family)